jgi:hypothetical protein
VLLQVSSIGAHIHCRAGNCFYNWFNLLTHCKQGLSPTTLQTPMETPAGVMPCICRCHAIARHHLHNSELPD